MVSISATTPPAALSRLTSPGWPDLLATVNVWVPARAEVQSGAHWVPVTVTAVVVAALADGSTAIAAAAASAGTSISTPATAHGRRAASRSHWAAAQRRPGGPAGAGAGTGAAGDAAAWAAGAVRADAVWAADAA